MDKQFLDTFWKISEGKDEQRVEATITLLDILQSRQGKSPLPCTELTYTLKRLVRGLASTRKWARLGFAMALTQVLRLFTEVSTSAILELVQSELKLMKSDAKSDQSNILLGQAMACLSLIQSECIFKAAAAEMSQVTKMLLKIARKKVPLHHLSTQGLVALVTKASDSCFQEGVWPELEPQLNGGWDGCTPDTLLLLMAAVTHRQAEVGKKYLTAHWGGKHLWTDKNMANLANIFAASVCDHPIVHPVCREVVTTLAKKPTVLSAFWTTVVEGKLLTNSTMQKKYLAFQLVPQVLPHLATPEQVSFILSPLLVSCLVKNMSGKQMPLHGAATKLAEQLTSFVKRCGDGEMQVAVVMALIQTPGSVLFDGVTKSRTVQTMIADLKATGARKVAALCMDIVLGNSTLQSASEDAATQQKWAVSVLSRMPTHVAMATDKQWIPSTLQFLFLRGFFTVRKPVPKIRGCEKPSPELDQTVTTCLQAAFFQALDRLSTFKPDKGSKHQRLYVDTLYDTVQYAQTLLQQDAESVQPQELMESEICRDQWKQMLEVVSKIRAKKALDKMNIAFELLFLHHGLQLFTDSGSAIDVLEELHACYAKASQKEKIQSSKGTESSGEPEWMDVMIDQLLSLLSQQSHLVRVVVNNVFAMLCPNITAGTLQLILDVMKPQQEGTEAPLGFEDSEEEEDSEAGSSADSPGGEHSEDEAMEQEDESASASSSSEDEEDEEDEEMPEMVDAATRKKLKAALGQAAISSGSEEEESEEEEEDELDDDAMMRVDGALADVFRNMRRSTKKADKDRETQLKHYRMRCLDLLETLINSNPTASTLLELVFPLLELMESGVRDKSLQDLSSRALKVFQQLCRPRKLAPDPALDRTDLPEVFRALLQYSTKVPDIALERSVASACLFVLRLMLNQYEEEEADKMEASPRKPTSPTKKLKNGKKNRQDDGGNLEKVLGILRQVIQDYCQKRDSKLSQALVYTLLERQTTLLWPIADLLLQCFLNADIRIFCRTKVGEFLAAMISKKTAQDLGAEVWEEFVGRVMTDVYQLLVEQTSQGNLKQRFVHQVLKVLHKVMVLCSDTLLRTSIPGDLVDKVKSLKAKVSKDTKVICNKLIAINERINSKDTKEIKAERKRKRKEERRLQAAAAAVATSSGDDGDEESPVKRLKGDADSGSKSTEKTKDKKKKKKKMTKQKKKQSLTNAPDPRSPKGGNGLNSESGTSDVRRTEDTNRLRREAGVATNMLSVSKKKRKGKKHNNNTGRSPKEEMKVNGGRKVIETKGHGDGAAKGKYLKRKQDHKLKTQSHTKKS